MRSRSVEPSAAWFRRAEVGALYWAVRSQWEAQAGAWVKVLKELSGFDDEALRRTVEENPVIAEIVGLAWQTAAETASEDKRRLLAKVALQHSVATLMPRLTNSNFCSGP